MYSVGISLNNAKFAQYTFDALIISATGIIVYIAATLHNYLAPR